MKLFNQEVLRVILLDTRYRHISTLETPKEASTSLWLILAISFLSARSIGERSMFFRRIPVCGTAFKQLAELHSERATAEATGSAKWLEKGRSALERSRQAYSTGFLRNRSHHWSGVQYLALESVLKGSVSVEHWYACKVAATADSRRNDTSAGIWALGSLAELALLPPVAGVNFDSKETIRKGNAFTAFNC
jgi:hypothetical protein